MRSLVEFCCPEWSVGDVDVNFKTQFDYVWAQECLPKLETWLVEEYAPTIQDWVEEQLIPEVDKYIKDHYVKIDKEDNSSLTDIFKR